MLTYSKSFHGFFCQFGTCYSSSTDCFRKRRWQHRGRYSTASCHSAHSCSHSSGTVMKLYKVLVQFFPSIPEFPNPCQHMNGNPADCVAVLGCTRCSLGIFASSRGTVAGRLLMKVHIIDACSLLVVLNIRAQANKNTSCKYCRKV